MEEIISRLYIGGDPDYDKVARREGWSFLRCCKYGPGGHQQTLGYHSLGAPKGKNYLSVRRGNLMALNMLDMDDPTFISEDMIDAGLKFIDERMRAGDRVLVACNKGVSRGPTTALMYLRSIGEMPHSFLKSEKVFRTLYRHYDPAQGIRQYARSHWADLENSLNGGQSQS